MVSLRVQQIYALTPRHAPTQNRPNPCTKGSKLVGV